MEAETIAWSEGLKLEGNKEIRVYVTDIHHSDYLKMRDVDFGSIGVAGFEAKVASRYFGGDIEFRLDNKNSALIGNLNVGYIGDWDKWVSVSTAIIEKVNGVQDLYFLCTSNEPHELFRFVSCFFEKK